MGNTVEAGNISRQRSQLKMMNSCYMGYAKVKRESDNTNPLDTKRSKSQQQVIRAARESCQVWPSMKCMTRESVPQRQGGRHSGRCPRRPS
eukprot:3275393-Pleurochrysis_carterae.AAC.5